MSLHEQLHFAVFLRLYFVDSVPAHTDFQDEKQDISLLWPYVTARGIHVHVHAV